MSNSPLIDDNEVLSLLRHSKIKAAQYIRNTAGLSLTDCVAYIDKLRASRENSTKGKQTVEEAARDFAGSEFTHEDGPFSTFVPLQTGFNAGAAWQKEQAPFTLKDLESAIDMARSPSWSKEELIKYIITGELPD